MVLMNYLLLCYRLQICSHLGVRQCHGDWCCKIDEEDDEDDEDFAHDNWDKINNSFRHNIDAEDNEALDDNWVHSSAADGLHRSFY